MQLFATSATNGREKDALITFKEELTQRKRRPSRCTTAFRSKGVQTEPS